MLENYIKIVLLLIPAICLVIKEILMRKLNFHKKDIVQGNRKWFEFCISLVIFEHPL